MKNTNNKAHTTIVVGRAIYGVQSALYRLANEMDVEVDIKRLPRILDVEYVINVTGDKAESYVHSIKTFVMKQQFINNAESMQTNMLFDKINNWTDDVDGSAEEFDQVCAILSKRKDLTQSQSNTIKMIIGQAGITV